MTLKPTFGYWDIRGFGQPVRLLLAYLDVDYTEKAYKNGPEDKQTWFDEKFTHGLDFPNLPYWKDEENKVTEKLAILKYLSRKYNGKLMPVDGEMWKAEMLEGVCTDIWDLLVGISYYGGPEQYEAFNGSHAVKLEQISKFIGKFSLGNQLSYVDFLLYEVLYQYVRHNKDVLSPFPKLQAFLKTIEALPQIAAYYARNPAVVSWPCFSKAAKIQF